jgi:hypothetical protein
MNVAVAPRVTRAAEGLARRPFTVAEVEPMVEAGIIDGDERVELIGGELVPMSATGRLHEAVKVAINFRWCRLCPETCRLAPETTFRLSDDTYFEPDFVIYPHASGLTGLSQSNVLLVVEIADSSRRYDTGRKAKLYAGFGSMRSVARRGRSARHPRPDMGKRATSARRSRSSHSWRPRNSPCDWTSLNLDEAKSAVTRPTVESGQIRDATS